MNRKEGEIALQRTSMKQKSVNHSIALSVNCPCNENDDCFGTLTCYNERCSTPCSSMRCGPNASCLYVNSRAGNRCRCIPPYIGDGDVGCFERADSYNRNYRQHPRVLLV
ncbi:hypothetical protein PV325_000771 [Microctonus aethiopoides]|nr:hypothetical protein PV325_000771 [Microctonus aethiopoides]